MGEVADSAAAFLLDRPPTMSDEDTDYVLDEHIMGEVVLSESTFPAAPLVRPPMMVRHLVASAAVAPGAPDGAAAAACQGALAGFAEPGRRSVQYREHPPN